MDRSAHHRGSGMSHVAVVVLVEVIRLAIIAVPVWFAYEVGERRGRRVERARLLRIVEQEKARIRERYGLG
jgi:hypothetical protein